MSKLKIATIGGGSISTAHLPHLARRDDVELVGLADLNPAAQQTADNFGIERFVADYRELLPLCDAVLICVPTFLHADIACEALGAGKAVFCEKPLARTMEQADKIAAAVSKSEAPLQVGFVRRFSDEWLRWGEVVEQGKIGRPVVWHDLASGPGPDAPWFGRDEQGGGPFLDGCIHNFDFALKTFGAAKWAFCNGRTLRQGTTAIDTGTATVHFESGDELMLAWSWGLPSGCAGARVFEILGSEGLLRWPMLAAIDASAPPGADSSETAQPHFLIERAQNSEKVFFPTSALVPAFGQQMDEFVAVARGEVKPRAGIAEGRAALQLALAVLQSARSSHVVPVEEIQ